MMFGKDPEQQGLADLERGVKEFQEGVDHEEEKLRQLFASLKTDILDEFLADTSAAMKEKHLSILDEQVRHVISISRAIGYKELTKSFEQEERALKEIRDLVERYPDAAVSSRADLRGALEELRGMLKEQQSMIFNHEEILLEEKQRLVGILNQVHALKAEHERDTHLKGPDNSLDKKEQYI